MKIPVIGVIDTNSDPDPIDYPLAANDDAIKSISVLTKAIAEAAVEAQAKVRAGEMEEAADEKKAEKSEDNVEK